jgi:hypothetical protein
MTRQKKINTNLVCFILNKSSYIKEYLSKNDGEEDHHFLFKELSVLLKRFEEIKDCVSMPFVSASTTELKEWIIYTDLATWETNELISNEIEDEKYFKIKCRLDKKYKMITWMILKEPFGKSL